MSQRPLVSIVIPTYQRPRLLEETIASCLAQDYRPLELVVGDDSPEPVGRPAAEAAASSPGVSVQYLHHDPSLGQADNVNSLFKAATGKRLLLLHDDDRLLPGAVSTLSACFDRSPGIVAAFGRQRLIDDHGSDLGDEKCESMNHFFRKRPEDSGLQAESIDSALLRQFPNNAYLVRTEAARNIGVRSKELAGDACDADFGVRLALRHPGKTFFLVPEYTAEYRITDQAISRSGCMSADYYSVLRTLSVPARSEPTRQAALRQLAGNATGQFARRGQRAKAIGVYLSRCYGWKRRLSVRGMSHLARILSPVRLPF